MRRAWRGMRQPTTRKSQYRGDPLLDAVYLARGITNSIVPRSIFFLQHTLNRIARSLSGDRYAACVMFIYLFLIYTWNISVYLLPISLIRISHKGFTLHVGFPVSHVSGIPIFNK